MAASDVVKSVTNFNSVPSGVGRRGVHQAGKWPGHSGGGNGDGPEIIKCCAQEFRRTELIG
jgi:hypothetical protein